MKDIKRHFTKKDVEIAKNKNVFDIINHQKRKVKTTICCHYALIRISFFVLFCFIFVFFFLSDKTKYWQGCRETKSLLYCQWFVS